MSNWPWRRWLWAGAVVQILSCLGCASMAALFDPQPEDPTIRADVAGSAASTRVKVRGDTKGFRIHIDLGSDPTRPGDRDRVRNVAYQFNPFNPPLPEWGVPTTSNSLHLMVEVTKILGTAIHIVHKKEIMGGRMDSYGADSFSLLIDSFLLEPGDYVIAVTMLEGSPALHGITTTMHVGYRWK